MRIIVVSDSHGCYDNLSKAFLRNSKADVFVFLGDGENDVVRFRNAHPDIPIMNVAGNCDSGSIADNILFFVCGGRKIMATHGHNFGVKGGTGRLMQYARNSFADIVLFGHTHVRKQDYDNGIYILNPGSAGCPNDGNKPSYGFVDITEAGVVTNVVDIIP